ncbi:unnamed protein product [Mycena citricolor]|uniref:Uncharacterized protein n=1 Tax=Mycena citricolor TaxID=2018698 RepID=A0AAD2HY27_9AGAR|nr:unnamed protein product [Mycena citricolor]
MNRIAARSLENVSGGFLTGSGSVSECPVSVWDGHSRCSSDKTTCRSKPAPAISRLPGGDLASCEVDETDDKEDDEMNGFGGGAGFLVPKEKKFGMVRRRIVSEDDGLERMMCIIVIGKGDIIQSTSPSQDLYLRGCLRHAQIRWPPRRLATGDV